MILPDGIVIQTETEFVDILNRLPHKLVWKVADDKKTLVGRSPGGAAIVTVRDDLYKVRRAAYNKYIVRQ